MNLRANEQGSGLVGAIGGVAVFLVLLSFAVQLLFNAYATSAITAAASPGCPSRFYRCAI